ncbi:MAG: glycosyltransferase family 4 protein [Clostridia bacterium]|jgi:glycosyltransferase involved in cell wall biosynthesis|nr:glycosyltransferase family 4 protein [Clostridia bacterium]
MKVAVDARMYNMSGIGTYIQNLMKNGLYDIAIGKKEELEGIKEIEKIIEFDSPIYGIKEQLKFPYKELKREKPDILHVPHYNVPIFYKGDMIVTIHDLTHIVYGEFISPFARFYAKVMMKIACKKAKIILTDAEYTKKDLLKYFKVDENKIKPVYLGAKEKIVPKEKEEISYLYEKFNIPKNKKLLMFVGNLKEHKNLERLLIAFSRLKKNKEYTLLLVRKSI